MNKILRLSLLAALIFTANFASAQYNMYSPDKDQANPLDCSIEAAGGLNFEDDGGNYSPNMDESVTFCPDLSQGSKVSVAFATNIGFSFNIDPSDTLYIFDGPTITSPLLAAINSGNSPLGGSWSASFANNPSGCLTFRFKSDAANEADGWLGRIACGNAAQPYTPHLEAYVNGGATNVLNPLDTGFVNVCAGDSILLVATPEFPYALEETGTGYSQTLENVNYLWNITGAGSIPTNNDSIWFVANQHQGYYVSLKITDQFPQLMDISAKIRVSIVPSFATGGPIEDTICLGSEAILIGGVNSSDTAGVEIPGGTFTVGGSFAGLTALPDGAGQQYETTVNISGMGGGTVTSPSDIASVCLDIEHSFIGDLEITLTCPNGTEVSLMNTYPGNGLVPGGCSGGGTFLGSDTNIDGGAPGTPVETYCFSTVSPQFGTICASLNNTYINPYGFASMIPGTYTPDGNFSDFVGCPLDGNWTISVRDNQGIDDGYIFQWGLTFNADLYPNSDTYQNYVVTSFWSADPTIISGQNDTSIVAVPTNVGAHYYTYNVTDDYGCHYDTTFRVVTIQTPIIFNDTFACDLHYQIAGTVSAPGGGVWVSTPATGLNFSSTSVNNPNVTATVPGNYVLSFTDNACQQTVTSTLYFPPYPQIFDDTSLCADQFQVTGTLSDPLGGTWSSTFTDVTFTPPNGLNPIITPQNSGVYQITYTDNICQNSTTSTLTLYILPHIFDDTFACNFAYQVGGTIASDGGVWSSADTNIHFGPNNNIMDPAIFSSVPGQYEVTFTDNQCQMAVTSTIDFIQYAYVEAYDTVLCAGMTVPLTVYAQPQNDSYSWSNGNTGPTVIATAGNEYTITVSNECNSSSDVLRVFSKVCEINVPNIITLSSKSGNDKFYLTYDGVKSMKMVIVNRWGNTISEINDPSKAWDGRDLNGNVVAEGTYFYTLSAEMETGETINQQGFVQVYE